MRGLFQAGSDMIVTKTTEMNIRMMHVRFVAGRFLDRINMIDRIMRVRVESWSSRKELQTIPLSRSNYFLQLSLNLVNLVNPV